MDRAEVIKVYSELVALCRLECASVSLVAIRKDDTLSMGYQLHISESMESSDRGLVNKILESNQLALIELNDKIIIYKSIRQ
jgi:hypothetical protein